MSTEDGNDQGNLPSEMARLSSETLHNLGAGALQQPGSSTEEEPFSIKIVMEEYDYRAQFDPTFVYALRVASGDPRRIQENPDGSVTVWNSPESAVKHRELGD